MYGSTSISIPQQRISSDARDRSIYGYVEGYPVSYVDTEGLELNVRYFVIEDGVDVSAYDSFESAVLAIEPADIPRMKLFDELGNEYALSVGRKQTRFLGIWPSTVDSTTASAVSCAAALELENCLREYASKATILVPTDAGLPELVKLIATPSKKCHLHPLPAAKAGRVLQYKLRSNKLIADKR